ncbi:MAG: glycosyltransferase family 39 protein [Candidatus Margulisbacteria bacterium]|nr:glycosyltransferase family 39 protein [Candidatus Margulisiibacteriota bacterium]
MILAVFLVITTLFRLIVGRYFPLIGDEAFYWLWSQHLDLSYVDHPPMIAYYIKGLTLIFGNTELAIRLGAIILVTLITFLVYKIGKELFGEKAGLISAIIFNLTPTFFGGGIFLVPQQPFLLFWTLSIFLFVKLIKTNQAKYWYLLGLTVGLGLLSDYVMLLFFPAVGLYLLLNKNLRFWWQKAAPYLGALLACLAFSPVIIWNLKQGFTPLFYWSGKMGGTPNYLQNFLTFVSLEMVLYTPILLLLVIYLIFRLRKFDDKITFLGCLSLMVFLPFLLISPLMLVGGHWPAAAYIPAILFLGQLAGKKLKWLAGLTLFFVVLINFLAFSYYLFIYPTPPSLKSQEFSINKTLPQFLAESTSKKGQTFYLANNLGVAGLVAFHGKVNVHMAPGRLRQFDIWGEPQIKRGDNMIYFVLNEKEVYRKLLPLFSEVKTEQEKRLFTKDADIPQKTEIYHCLGYKGGILP